MNHVELNLVALKMQIKIFLTKIFFFFGILYLSFRCTVSYRMHFLCQKPHHQTFGKVSTKKNNLVPSSIKCEGNILKSLSQRIESFVTSDEPRLKKSMKFLKKEI